MDSLLLEKQEQQYLHLIEMTYSMKIHIFYKHTKSLSCCYLFLGLFFFEGFFFVVESLISNAPSWLFHSFSHTEDTNLFKFTSLSKLKMIKQFKTSNSFWCFLLLLFLNLVFVVLIIEFKRIQEKTNKKNQVNFFSLYPSVAPPQLLLKYINLNTYLLYWLSSQL